MKDSLAQIEKMGSREENIREIKHVIKNVTENYDEELLNGTTYVDAFGARMMPTNNDERKFTIDYVETHMFLDKHTPINLAKMQMLLPETNKVGHFV